MQEVTAVFDIGKTNKKFLLFNKNLEVLHQEETVFKEIVDDDGFACDDIVNLVAWVRVSLERTIHEGKFDIQYLNFTTYGASLVYLDKEGNRITPLYNYLKPMPDSVLDGFYDKYGGVEEFSRKTASPALDMLNSGLQALWLKKEKPQYWAKVKYILHLPQYMSYLFTSQICAGYPSIGCHTATWDFDNKQYHPWLEDEKIEMPEPIPSDVLFEVEVSGVKIKTGIGVHDSSGSLVPYLKAFSDKKFLLVSTGTWAINMNPFSTDPLTDEELKQDCLCFLSVEQQQVKSSRLFLGHIHEVNTKSICSHFGIALDYLKTMCTNEKLLQEINEKDEFLFFPEGIPTDYMGNMDVLDSMETAERAYHQFIYELAVFEANAIRLVFDKDEKPENIYIAGGFVKNDIFCRLLATLIPETKVFKAEIYNATALGTAMLVNKEISSDNLNIELEAIEGIN